MNDQYPSSSERLIATWSDNPYTGVNKRYITVKHRIVAYWYDGIGVDIVHQIQCGEQGYDDWTPAKTWEFRQHGVEKMTTDPGRGLP